MNAEQGFALAKIVEAALIILAAIALLLPIVISSCRWLSYMKPSTAGTIASLAMSLAGFVLLGVCIGDCDQAYGGKTQSTQRHIHDVNVTVNGDPAKLGECVIIGKKDAVEQGQSPHQYQFSDVQRGGMFTAAIGMMIFGLVYPLSRVF